MPLQPVLSFVELALHQTHRVALTLSHRSDPNAMVRALSSGNVVSVPANREAQQLSANVTTSEERIACVPCNWREEQSIGHVLSDVTIIREDVAFQYSLGVSSLTRHSSIAPGTLVPRN